MIEPIEAAKTNAERQIDMLKSKVTRTSAEEKELRTRKHERLEIKMMKKRLDYAMDDNKTDEKIRFTEVDRIDNYGELIQEKARARCKTLGTDECESVNITFTDSEMDNATNPNCSDAHIDFDDDELQVCNQAQGMVCLMCDNTTAVMYTKMDNFTTGNYIYACYNTGTETWDAVDTAVTGANVTCHGHEVQLGSTESGGQESSGEATGGSDPHATWSMKRRLRRQQDATLWSSFRSVFT